MKTKIVLVLLIVLLFSVSVQAQEQNKQAMMEKMPKEAGQAMNAGNMICPVTGEKIGDMGEPAHYEYKGKVYNFCCEGCVETFKENPEKYVNIVEEEKQNKMMEKNDQHMSMPMK